MITPLDILSLETWILIISVLVLIRLYIHKRWQVLKNLNIPHDPPSILGLGNLGEMIKDQDTVFNQDLIKKKKYGFVYGSYTLLQARISISDPAILKQIFVKEAATFPDRQKSFTQISGKVMNSAVATTSGDQWKRIRTTLSPTFSASKLKEMIGIIEQCTDEFVDVLRRKADNEEGVLDVKDVFGKLSMDVMCSAAFSVNAHTQSREETELIKKAKLLFSNEFFKNPLIYLIMLFPWTEKIVEKFNYCIYPKEFTNYFWKLTDTLIANKSDSNYKQRVDIMQQMLQNEISEEDVLKGAAKGMTRPEIIGNSIMMIAAGYETTATTLVFFSYCLATSEEIQKTVREEIESSVEEHNGLTYEGINSMKYLDMCLKESQRLYGAIPRNSRCAEKDITINGIKIPAGMYIDVPLYGLSHDEEYWDEPMEYKPERFEDMSKIDPMVFQPFGAGPRNCIGMRFAIVGMKMAICKLLLHFDLGVCEDTPAPPLPLTCKGGMRPKKDLYLKVTPRKTSSNEPAPVQHSNA